MTQTETVYTAHGEVEYEIVECDSCGDSVRKTNAQRYYIGDVRRTRLKFGHRQVRFDKKTPAKGWACEYCRENGVVGFPHPPSRVKEAFVWWFMDRFGLTFRGIMTCVVVAVVVIAAIVTVIL